MKEFDGFQRRRELKKIDIVEAALSLFMQHGTKKVSVAEIAKKANASQVTIYNYFDNKDNLIYKVIIYFVDQTWKEYEEGFDRDLPFPDKIKAMIFHKKTDAEDISEQFFHDFMKGYPAGIKYIEDMYENKILPRFLELIEEGKEHGYVDATISNEAILMYIQMFRDFLLKDDIHKQALPFAEDLTKIFFYGIVGENKESN